MNLSKILNAISHREVLKNLPDAVFVLETDGRICWVNKKAVTLFEVEKSILQNCHFEDFVNEGMNVVVKSANKRMSVITAAVSANNKEFFVELNAKFYDDQYYVSLRDVTAMTDIFNNAEETNRLNKDKNVMLSKLSNDFKSPLQSMLGFSQALLDGLGGEISEKQQKYIKIINKNASDMLYFMDKFLDYSKSESISCEPDCQPFDVINTIQAVIRNNENALAAKNLTVNFDCEHFEKKTIYSDEAFIKNILQNILETSVKLTEIGFININLSVADENVVNEHGLKSRRNKFMQITVSDTGMGLTESEVQDLFDPYAHLDKVNKKNIVRTFGLGCAVNLAEKLGGTLWVNAEVMKGCEFNIILPIDKEVDE